MTNLKEEGGRGALGLAFGRVRSVLGFGMEGAVKEAAVSGCLPLDLEESLGVGLTFEWASSVTRTRFVALTFVLRMDFSCLGVGLVDISGVVGSCE